MFISNEDIDGTALGDINEKAPDFVLKTEKGENWRLSDYLGNVVALLFYPQNETLVCTRQLCSIRDNWTDYLQTKAVIVGISSATVKEQNNFGQHYNLPMSLLADNDRKVTQIYGKHWLIPIFLTRAIVIIDAKGFVRTRQIMLRAFRPTDRKVITSILAARADAVSEKYKSLVEKYRKAE